MFESTLRVLCGWFMVSVGSVDFLLPIIHRNIIGDTFILDITQCIQGFLMMICGSVLLTDKKFSEGASRFFFPFVYIAWFSDSTICLILCMVNKVYLTDNVNYLFCFGTSIFALTMLMFMNFLSLMNECFHDDCEDNQEKYEPISLTEQKVV
jgi:hypothetical protein